MRLNKLTISEFTIIAGNDNLKINWGSYIISRPKKKINPSITILSSGEKSSELTLS